MAFSSFSLALKALSLSCSLGMRSGVMKTDWIQSGLDTPRSLILLHKISFFNFKEATINVFWKDFYQVVLDFQQLFLSLEVFVRWFGPGQNLSFSLEHYCW